MMAKSAIVIGAGIVGLACARALALKAFSVTVIERCDKAVGASIRNFGMIWPVGQPAGNLYDRALRSRAVWKEIADSGAFWYSESGSLHLAYHQDEWSVLKELLDVYSVERDLKLLTPKQVVQRSEAVREQNLLGGLFSPHEIIVDPREAIAALPTYLHEKFKIDFQWGLCVHSISGNTVNAGDRVFETDVIFLCSGTDLETLYPSYLKQQDLTKCKLQMMRLASQPLDWKIGPALCGGLSLIHYKSFNIAKSLEQLRKRYHDELKEYIDWGIHVMVSQNGRGELTIGDSHEYGSTHDPFDRDHINQLIISYLQSFAQFKDWSVIESWHGLYTKHRNGAPNIFCSPEPGVYILNALGGAGMTLSFGLAEEVVAGI